MQDVSLQGMASPFFCVSVSLALCASTPVIQAAPGEPAGKARSSVSQADKAALMELPAEGNPTAWIGDNAPASWKEGHLYLYECWATWCGPCLASMPHLENLHRSLAKTDNVHILGLNVDNDMTTERLRAFIEKNLNISFPVGIASAQTQQLWLRPLDVRAIPFAFAVRNGKLVWKGSPRQLNVDMLLHLAEGKKAADVPQADPARQRQDMLVCVRGIFESLSRNDIAAAKRIAAEEDARKAKTGSSAHGMALFLVRAMVSTKHHDAAIDEAEHLAQTAREDERMLMQIADALAGVLLKSDQTPTEKDRRVLETALSLTQRAAALQEQAGKKPRYTPLSMAGILEKLDRSNEARSCLLQAIERSEYGTAWAKIQRATQEGIPLEEILQGSVKALIAMELASPQTTSAQPPAERWKEAGTSGPLSDVFKNTEWLTEYRPGSAPADGTLLISTQRNQRPLETVLRLRGWNFPGLHRVQLLCGPQLNLPRASATSPYPIGHLSDKAILRRLLDDKKAESGNEQLPEVMLWRDGHLLWHGETAHIPAWLGSAIGSPTFDWPRFQSERERDKKNQDRLTDLAQQAIALIKEGKQQEARSLLEEHLNDLYTVPFFALFAEEHLAGYDLRDKNYDAVGKRFQRLMQRYPQEFVIYSSVNKMLGSNDALQQAAYPAVMQALQGMSDTNLSSDPEYNAACYAVMAQLALQHKQQARARELGLRALAASGIVRRYLGLAR